MPEEAKQPTQAGAEAFLQYWWDVYTYSYQSGDTTLLTSISDLEYCESCRNYIREVNAMAAKGEFARNGSVRVGETSLLDSSDRPAFKFNFEIEQDPLQIADRQGVQLREQDARTGLRGDTLVTWQQESWAIAYFAEEGVGR